jgi:hypothetical protein
MSLLNTERPAYAALDGTIKADRYLLAVPSRHVGAPAKAAWWAGQILALVSVNVFGVGIMLVALHFSVLISTEANQPELGNIGMHILPFAVAGAIAGLVYRNWAKRVAAAPTHRDQVRTAVAGVLVVAAVGVASWVLSWVSIVVVALVAGH